MSSNAASARFETLLCCGAHLVSDLALGAACYCGGAPLLSLYRETHARTNFR